MHIHKEGIVTILVVLFALCLANVGFYYFNQRWSVILLASSAVLFLFIVSFFRNPTRSIIEIDDNIVYAPADGKIVVIEKTKESEYFDTERIQVSIFMSPLNVHVNRNPISAEVKYSKYHPGKYLAAWNPKASTENERTTVVYGNGNNEILMRQIAGALAKRIVCYLEEGQKVIQGADMGFIKFGSRVDLFLPLNADIQVVKDQKVKGNKTIIARLP